MAGNLEDKNPIGGRRGGRNRPQIERVDALSHCGHHWRRPAHEPLHRAAFQVGQKVAEHFGGDKSGSLGPVWRRLAIGNGECYVIEDVEQLELSLLFPAKQLLKLCPENDVLLRNVGKNQRDTCLVVGICDDSANYL